MYKYMCMSVFQEIFVLGIKKFSVHVYTNTYNFIKIIVDFVKQIFIGVKESFEIDLETKKWQLKIYYK